jgi:hypothetical protein
MLGDRALGELVVVGKTGCHACLVHRAGGLARGVRLKHPRLHGRALDRLDDHRNLGPTIRSPVRQALEAVEDLKAAIRRGRDTQGHSGQFGRVGPLAAQRRERGAQLIDGNEGDHVRGSSTGRIWKSG